MYGLRVVGTHGIAQIDSEYKNMVLVNKQQVTIPAYVPPSKGFAPLPFPAAASYDRVVSNSVIAVRKLSHFDSSATSAVGIWQTDIVNESGVHTGSGVDIQGGSSTAMTVIVYEFAFSGYDTSGYGLVVRNAANEVVFSSNNKPMRVVGSSRSDNLDLDARPKITLPANREYAIAMPERLHETAMYYGRRIDYWGAFNQIHSDSNYVFSHNAMGIPSASTSTPTYARYMQHLIAIDVTGY